MGAQPNRPFSRVIVLLIFLIAALSCVGQLRNSDCLDCHSDKTLTLTNADNRVVSLFVDETKLLKSAHRTNTCVSCHQDIGGRHPDDNLPVKTVLCAKCHQNSGDSYGASVHGLAAMEGKKGAATCVDCHGAHEVLPASSPDSPLYFARMTETCGQCHDDVARDVAGSIHGKATAKGNRDAATCIDCHFEHRIEKLKGVSALKISEQVCSKCHASERLNTKYNLPGDRVKTFFESYHGLAARYGSTLAANCASCHGVHKILPSTDPMSKVNKAHLVETCGKCHPGATEKFAQGKIHVDIAAANAVDLGGSINLWVRKAYLWLIAVVIGSMLVHNGLIFLRKVRAMYQGRPRTVLRMNLQQRIQHAVLIVSFVSLALSGFALKFPNSWLAYMLGSHEGFRAWTHRVAGVLLLAAGAYHVLYAVLTRDGRRLVKDFLPRKKDVSDLLLNARYLAGGSKMKPRFARFGYVEKAEYWAMVWGTILMGATGLMIWFKMDATKVVPRWVVDVATTIHYYEAILACLAIVVWHFYHVIFDPDVYPANWACVDGRVSKHWQEEEHPLEMGEKDEPVIESNRASVDKTKCNGEAKADLPPTFSI